MPFDYSCLVQTPLPHLSMFARKGEYEQAMAQYQILEATRIKRLNRQMLLLGLPAVAMIVSLSFVLWLILTWPSVL